MNTNVKKTRNHKPFIFIFLNNSCMSVSQICHILVKPVKTFLFGNVMVYTSSNVVHFVRLLSRCLQKMEGKVLFHESYIVIFQILNVTAYN